MVDYRSVAVVRRAVWLVAVAVVAVALAPAKPAAAHAYLFRSDPAAGQVLTRLPAAVSLTFSEPVQEAGASIAVYDDRLRKVDTGLPRHGRTVNVLTADVRATAGRGTFTVVWRVVSVDSHPAAGSFSFAVGQVTGVSGATRAPPVTRRSVALVLGVARFASYAGLVAGPGAVITVLLLWPAGRRRAAVRRLVGAGVGLLVLGTLALYVAQGANAAGLGLSKALSPAAFAAVGHSRLGQAALIRLYLLALLVLLTPAVLGRRRVGVDLVALLGCAGVVVTFAVAGHARVGRWPALAVPADALHVAAMTAWLGALAVIVVARRPGPGGHPPLERVSALALGCVAALAVTGVGQAARETGSLAALTGTTYGRLVIAKTVGLLLLAGLGELARRRVAADRTAEPGFDRGIRAELGIAGVVLVLASVLVVTDPARTAYAAPVVRHLRYAGVQLDVRVGPPRVGVPMRVRVSGPAEALVALSGRMRLPDSGLPPLLLQFAGAAGGARTAPATVPAPGPWLLELDFAPGQPGGSTIATTVPVR